MEILELESTISKKKIHWLGLTELIWQKSQ